MVLSHQPCTTMPIYYSLYNTDQAPTMLFTILPITPIMHQHNHLLSSLSHQPSTTILFIIPITPTMPKYFLFYHTDQTTSVILHPTNHTNIAPLYHIQSFPSHQPCTLQYTTLANIPTMCYHAHTLSSLSHRPSTTLSIILPFTPTMHQHAHILPFLPHQPYTTPTIHHPFYHTNIAPHISPTCHAVSICMVFSPLIHSSPCVPVLVKTMESESSALR